MESDSRVRIVDNKIRGGLVHIDYYGISLIDFNNFIKKYFLLDTIMKPNEYLRRGLYYLRRSSKLLIFYLGAFDESNLISNIDSENPNNTIKCNYCDNKAHLVNNIYNTNKKYFYCHECGTLITI